MTACGVFVDVGLAASGTDLVKGGSHKAQGSASFNSGFGRSECRLVISRDSLRALK